MDGQKISVLLLEGDPGCSAEWDRILADVKDANIQFTRLSQTSDASSQVGNPLPDVIVFEVLSGGDTGLKKFLSVQKLAPNVPVIVVTGADNQRFSIEALQEGARDCLVKGRGPSWNRSFCNAIWHQIYSRQLRSTDLMEDLIETGHDKVLPADIQQRLKLQGLARQSILLKFKMSALEEAAARLGENPYDAEAHFYRARLLEDLGRVGEARLAYLEMLDLEPTRFGALNAPGAAFIEAYSDAVSRHPDHPMGHANLGDLLRANGKKQAALEEYNKALKLKPDCGAALLGKKILALETDKAEAGGVPRLNDPEGSRGSDFSYPRRPLVPVLLLISAADCDAPFQKFLDGRKFLVNTIVGDFYDPSKTLPEHRLVVNAIGDADLCGAALKSAEYIAARTAAPVINDPSLVIASGRANNAVRFSSIPGVRTPAILNIPREILSNPGGYDRVARHGFSYPFLLRSPGYHVGRHFQLISNERDLADGVATLPGKTLSLIQYLDAQGRDEKIRKYRVMTINGELYPAHLAVSRQWKVHYFSADMADYPEHRAEDDAFLRDMKAVVGARVFNAIVGISKMLALDYGGIDFGIDLNGNAILFEANAYMNVPLAESDNRWDYRRESISRIWDATRRMLWERPLILKG